MLFLCQDYFFCIENAMFSLVKRNLLKTYAVFKGRKVGSLSPYLVSAALCSDNAASSISCIQVVIWSGFNVYIQVSLQLLSSGPQHCFTAALPWKIVQGFRSARNVTFSALATHEHYFTDA